MSTTIVGAGAAIMAGTTLTLVGDGDGTVLIITTGAGVDTMAAGVTHTTDGAGLEPASDGAAIMAGVATTVVTGTNLIIIEVITAEAMLT